MGMEQPRGLTMSSHTGRQSVNTSNVLSVIMGGGQGTRLFPLTKERAKPAVPLAGKYRLLDIPISNCINSGLRRIYLLTQLVDKSSDPAVQDTLKSPVEWYPRLGIKGEGDLFLASMGIYVFSRNVIQKLLDNTLTDFGKHIIPKAIEEMRVFSSVFQGYWEDTGTIRSFSHANLDRTT